MSDNAVTNSTPKNIDTTNASNKDLKAMIHWLITERDKFIKEAHRIASLPCESDECSELYKALCNAQAEMPRIEKTTAGGRGKYSALEHVIEAVRPILQKHGLSVLQRMAPNNVLRTRLAHNSGQWIESHYLMPFPESFEIFKTQRHSQQDYMQYLGSVRTYCRRYELCAILGIQPEKEDTDGI